MTVTSPAGSASTAKARRTSAFRWVPAAAGWTVGIIATLSLLASVSPFFRSLIKVPREFVNDYIFNFPDTSFAWAFVLALLAAALAARKSIAWWILVGYMVAAVGWNVGDIVSGEESWLQESGEIIGLAFHIAAIAFLVLARKEFWAKVRRGALIKAAATLVAGLAVGTLIGWGLIELFPGSLAREDRFFYALNRVGAFAGASSDSFTGHPHVFVNALLGLFGALALMVAAIVLFQSQRAENALTGEDESAIRGLLELYGKNDSLGYFATRRDKSVVFAPTGRAAITYRVEVGVCLASGDPLGDPKAWPQAIEAWLLLCQAYGWAPGVMGASSTAAEAFRAAGLNALQLGDEAILYPDNFRLSGPDMRAVRQAVTRARRAGATVRIRRHRDLDADEMDTVVERADTWRDTDDERGFSMALGRLGDPADGDCLLVEAVQPGAGGDQVVAMLSLVPWGRQRGVAGSHAPLPAIPQRHHRADGQRTVPAGRRHWGEPCFAEFRDVPLGVRTRCPARRRSGRAAVARPAGVLLPLVAAGDLYRSNMKYQPEWVPRYACYEDARLVPRVGVASVIAEGFLVLPFSRRHEQPHTGHHTAVPQSIVDRGLLHHDGTAPDVDELQVGLDEEERSRLPEQVRVRMAKLKTLQDSGIDAYPVGEEPSHTILAAIESEGAGTVTVAGRVLRIRDYGGVLFAQLRDWSGEVQLLLDNSLLEEGTTVDFTHAIDLGDLIGVSGTMGFSKKGTRSLIVLSWRMIGKCLRPLPDKWKGLTDQEARVRARYVDLAINSEARDLIRARSGVLHAIRETLFDKGFLEVETPILQQIHGGANARPFLTHINAYDLDLYLRIAPELYLKRLCVGGVERVFELGRAFRNEGVDFSHNPEFTLLEAYQAHADYNVWIDGCRELIQNAALAANGAHVFMRPRDEGTLEPVDISGAWTVKTVHEAVSEALGEEIGPETDLTTLRRLCDGAKIPYLTHWDTGAVVLELYEHLVEDRTEAPTFYKDFPTSVSPLTRPHRSIPGVAERWDLVAWGVELGTAYSELTDPVEQRRRLQEQSLLAAGGDPEAMELDEDFLQAMEYAMPPTGGLGMGVDRVVMLITGRSIRETLPFPLAKPR